MTRCCSFLLHPCVPPPPPHPSVVTLANPVAVLLNPKKRGTPHAPACDRACVWLIENVVATHVRAHIRQVGGGRQGLLGRRTLGCAFLYAGE